MTFQDKVKIHMSQYTTSEINDEVKGGEFRGKRYSHILDKEKDADNEKLNILPEFRGGIYQDVMCKIKKHMYFHHLNSSQAMCINFFYPLVKHNMMNLILSMIKSDEDWGAVKCWAFEKKSDEEEVLEKKYPYFGEPTNFDFYIETNKGFKVSFEIKYTEAEFGMAEKKDGQFMKKYDDKFNAYQSLRKEWIVGNTCKNDFLTNYQLMRNILFLQDEKRYAVFLIPKDNIKVYEQAEQTKNWVTGGMKNHISILFWEDIWSSVKKNSNKILSSYCDEFHQKYLAL